MAASTLAGRPWPAFKFNTESAAKDEMISLLWYKGMLAIIKTT
jgi:hypothetical protein